MGGIKNLQGAWASKVVAKTGAYTILPSDCGTMFTNRGAGAGVTFTLPKTSPDLAGWWCEFFTVAAQILTVAANPVDTLVTTADAAADSVASIAAAGTHLRVVCDGTSFLVQADPGTVAGGLSVQDITVVT